MTRNDLSPGNSKEALRSPRLPDFLLSTRLAVLALSLQNLELAIRAYMAMEAEGNGGDTSRIEASANDNLPPSEIYPADPPTDRDPLEIADPTPVDPIAEARARVDAVVSEVPSTPEEVPSIPEEVQRGDLRLAA